MGLTPPSAARRVAGVVAMLATAAFGALVLGEYELTGLTPYVSGVLFGFAVAEVALTVGGDARVLVAVMSGAAAIAGMSFAGWISSGHGVAPFPVGAGVGAVLAGVVGFGWVRWSGTRGLGTQVDP